MILKLVYLSGKGPSINEVSCHWEGMAVALDMLESGYIHGICGLLIYTSS